MVVRQKGTASFKDATTAKKGLLEKPLANTAPSKHVPGLHGDHGSWQLDAARSLHKLATWIAATGKTLPPRSWNSFCWTDAGRCKLRCAAYLTASSSLDQGPSRKASHTKKTDREEAGQAKGRTTQRKGEQAAPLLKTTQDKTDRLRKGCPWLVAKVMDVPRLVELGRVQKISTRA